MCILRRFPSQQGPIDIAREIGVSYKAFGTFLLNDSTGNKVNTIEYDKKQNSVDTCIGILEEWLQGRGCTPITWATLVKSLRDADLKTLATDIDTVLQD